MGLGGGHRRALALVLDHLGDILREIGRGLNKVENRVSLSGHTDATPYVGGDRGFGNWELSTNRANASRRELVAGGMAENKMIRVVGLSSTVPYDKQDPHGAANRRISVVILNKRTEEAILRDGNAVEIDSVDAIVIGAGVVGLAVRRFF